MTLILKLLISGLSSFVSITITDLNFRLKIYFVKRYKMLFISLTYPPELNNLTFCLNNKKVKLTLKGVALLVHSKY